MTDVILGLMYLVVMLVASMIDIRQRRFPNVLFLVLLAVSIAVALRSYGLSRVGVHAGCAVVACGLLLGLECVWRRVRGAVGMGMGDIKALFCLMIVQPVVGLCALAVGLFALACAGLLLCRSSLPALPFIFVAFICIPGLFML